MKKKKAPTNVVKNLRNEVWKKIKMPKPTIKCNYYVSSHGRIKSKNKSTKVEYLLKGSPMKGGYLQLNVKLEDNHRSNMYVHKLVAKYFVPVKRTRETLYVAHKNGDKQNNKASNLKWLNRADLTKHHRKIGVYDIDRSKINYGDHVKMTVAKVKKLKKQLKTGRLTRTKLSENFGITMTQIKRIERGENWGHVTID